MNASEQPVSVDSSTVQGAVLSPKLGLQTLICELKLQKRHHQLLVEQNAALLACDRKSFAMLHEMHLALGGELEIQFKLRNSLFGTKKIDIVVKDWPDAERRSAERVIKDLKVVLLDISRLINQNRSLIGNQVKYIDFMLDILINTHRKGSMYGPQGRQSINRSNLLFNSAV